MSTPLPKPRPSPAYETSLGRMYLGSSEEILELYPITRRKGRVQLLFTSPPFVLNRKKKYGNHQGQEYVDWIASFAPLFREYVAERGSIVLELGNAWEPGQPTMTTLAMEALLAFKKTGDLHLCQEFICFNPARLPTPAQWVNVERSRVKDAFTRLWWMSTTPNPKADNRRVLTAYSDSMRKLLERGTYNPGKRPSEHQIGNTSFLKNNNGSIPPNVLIPSVTDMAEEIINAVPQVTNILPIANTSSSDPYQNYCREKGLVPHPARMPTKLVEFFIEFLTEPGDLIVDPFAGSNTTGAVAERLGRRWLSIEANDEYARFSAARF